MSLLGLIGLTRGKGARAQDGEAFVERRSEPREAVFQEVVLALADYHKIRAAIVNLTSRGARIQFSTRTELPFRVKLSAPTLKLNGYARVVWQSDDAAGLEFLREESDDHGTA